MVRVLDSHPKVVYIGCFVQSWALKYSVKWEWTMLRDHCVFYWWTKRACLAHLLYIFIFLKFSIGEEGKKNITDRLEGRGRIPPINGATSCCIGFISLFAHDCETMCFLCTYWHSMGIGRMPVVWYEVIQRKPKIYATEMDLYLYFTVGGFWAFDLRVWTRAIVVCGHLEKNVGFINKFLLGSFTDKSPSK